ncbi:MAG: DUF1592 domain-containing protein, partial [Planctomycetaceae bacterium]|nr:DUF1592 domain-containing protein [Planctomycetaceae bacterium]
MIPSKFLLVFLVFGSVGIVRGDSPHQTERSSFLKAHCTACHAGETPEGSLDLEQVSQDFRDAEVRRRWVLIHDRVRDGEMPPMSETQPDTITKSKFLKSLGESLTRADLASREVVLRRLNRREYENTVRDLFGISIDLENVLPNDSLEQGFDTIGSGLSISAEQMVLYLEAADLVLDEVFGPPKAPDRINETTNIKDLRSKTTADRITEDGVVLFSGAKTLPLYGVSVPSPGRYRLTVEVKAVQSKAPVIMRVDGGVTGRVASHVAGFFEVPPNKMTTIQLTDRAVERGDTFAFGLVKGYPFWKVGEDYQGPGLFVGNIQIEGPLEEWPRQSRLNLLGQVDPDKGTVEDLRAILSRVLPRAFRRTTDATQLELFIGLAKQALDEGQSFEKALRRGLKGMLCAPEFLFLEEQLSEGKPSFVDDFSLAARLSYFLWSSLPDQELHTLANRGELHRPQVLTTQVERMLKDPKSQRFVQDFTDQWLKLRDIDFTVPDQRLYPEYNQLLRQSMLDETYAFFREILDHNHSVQNFLDSDFVMLNGPLAEFYGIAGVSGLEMQRVKRPEKSLRGGVLTQASVLKVSADGTRTSPVLRGAWILEHLFGDPPPPPPPTVAAIEPDIRGASTIREQLFKHR